LAQAYRREIIRPTPPPPEPARFAPDETNTPSAAAPGSREYFQIDQASQPELNLDAASIGAAAAAREQEQLRAKLVERLLSDATEVANCRARLEQQLGTLHGVIGELDLALNDLSSDLNDSKGVLADFSRQYELLLLQTPWLERVGEEREEIAPARRGDGEPEETVQAIFVRIGEARFALPVSSVYGLGRLAREHYRRGQPYVYAGEDYAIYDLRALTGQEAAANSDSLPQQIPLLLVRVDDLRAAVAVDQILGKREIVVKPVGPQLASIPGILGAALIDDDSGMVVLELAPLVRRYLSRP
jgi:chemotaxis protein histidine kinase CheA